MLIGLGIYMLNNENVETPKEYIQLIKNESEFPIRKSSKQKGCNIATGLATSDYSLALYIFNVKTDINNLQGICV